VTISIGAGDAKRRTGVTYRQLDLWARNGYLRPIGGSSGSGRHREWPSGEVTIARRMGRLVDAGISHEQAAVFARNGWPRGEIAPGITLEVAP
jgi:DNA-binding transcriptional MerR regulator